MNDGKKQNNIIYFPGTKEQLEKKGIELLQQKNYHEAIPFLENLKALEPENSNIYVGLLLAYFDGGRIDQAMALVREMLHNGIGDEIDTINIYIMLLVQRHEYEQVIVVIKKMLEEDLSEERREYFSRLLSFSQKMVDNQIEIKKVEEEPIERKVDFFQYKDHHEQMVLARKLKDSNIIPYLEEIKEYLRSVDGDLFFKTLMINVLKEHQYDKPVEIEKFDRKIKVIPKYMLDISEDNELSEIKKLIEQKLDSEDPILFESIQSLMDRHIFLLYPFSLDFIELPAWAAAYHELGNEYFGNNQTESELLEKYGTKQLEMRKAKEFIKRIEEISYRNL